MSKNRGDDMYESLHQLAQKHGWKVNLESKVGEKEQSFLSRLYITDGGKEVESESLEDDDNLRRAAERMLPRLERL